MGKLRTIGLWFLQVVFGLLFVSNGSGKFLTMSESWAKRFAAWGYPAGFSYVIGGLEMLCGLALFVPKLAGWGAAGLVVIMVGATLTHVVHGQSFIWPLIFGALLAVVAYARRPPFSKRPEEPEPSTAKAGSAS